MNDQEKQISDKIKMMAFIGVTIFLFIVFWLVAAYYELKNINPLQNMF